MMIIMKFNLIILYDDYCGVSFNHFIWSSFSGLRVFVTIHFPLQYVKSLLIIEINNIFYIFLKRKCIYIRIKKSD